MLLGMGFDVFECHSVLHGITIYAYLLNYYWQFVDRFNVEFCAMCLDRRTQLRHARTG